MDQNEYWRECISEAADECDAKLTDAQIACIADTVAGAHECYGMAFRQPENPDSREISRLEKELSKERGKVGCNTCGGRGRLEYNAGPWGVNTECHKCHGEGKVSP